MVGVLSIPSLQEDAGAAGGDAHPHAPGIWLRFALLNPVVLGPELPSSDHSCTELPRALQSRVPSVGRSSPPASRRIFPAGVRARCCSIPKAAGSVCDHPARGLTWRLGSSSRKMKGLPKRRWRAAFMVSFSDLNFSCTKRCWT